MVQVYRTEDAAQSVFDADWRLRNTAVALGGFDALHIGHRAIIRKVVERAEADGLSSAVFLFRNQPRSVLGNTALPQVYPFEKRLELLEEMGVDIVIAEWFTPKYRTITKETFVREYVKNRLDARYAAVGFNYRFGRDGEGDTAALQALGGSLGIAVDTVAAVKVGGSAVSSSRIRELIQRGDMEEANRCLGRRFSVGGTVVGGNRLGRTIQFPTANLECPKGCLVPRFGVYLTQTKVGGGWYPSITNVGARPTVAATEPRIETHILDFSGDLYRQNIEVAFCHFWREIWEFENLDALKKQLASDRTAAKEYFER